MRSPTDSEQPLGFDAIIGNPPFVDSETMKREVPRHRHAMGCLHSSCQGNWDLFCPFVELGLRLAHDNGISSLVTPNRLLAADYAAAIQDVILRNSPLVCHDFSDTTSHFTNASIAVIILATRRREGVPSDQVRFIRYDERCRPRSRRTVPLSQLRALPEGYISAPLNVPDESILTYLECPTRLADVATLSDGATTGEAYQIRDYVRDLDGDDLPSDCVRIVNTGTVDPFRHLWGTKPISYLGFRGLRPVVQIEDLRTVSPRRVEQAQRPKVIVAGMASRIEAVACDDRTLCGKSACLIQPGENVCPHALAVVLNSDLMNVLYRALFGGRGFGRGSMNVGPRQLEQLPVPDSRYLRPWSNGTLAPSDESRLSYFGQQAVTAVETDAFDQVMRESERWLETRLNREVR